MPTEREKNLAFDRRGRDGRLPWLDVEFVLPTGQQSRRIVDGLDLVFELTARRCRRRVEHKEGLDSCRE